jgi:hypothetical protein
LFNFSANHLTLVSSAEYDRAIVTILKDENTKRCYKVYDYSKTFLFQPDKIYSISGKINAADKLYLILENVKEDKKHSLVKVQSDLGKRRH